jgi:hypothetical protein
MSENRQGIDRLRNTIEDVATEIENREAARTGWRPAWTLGLATAAALALIALLIVTWEGRTHRTVPVAEPSEVKVLVLKIHGRDVTARIVDDSAPATIIIMPHPERATPPMAAGVLNGGTR